MPYSSRLAPRRRLFTFADQRSAGLPAEAVVAGVCVWIVATGNGAFWQALLEGRALAEARTLGWILAWGVALTAGHMLLVLPWAWGRLTKPLLALLIVIAAGAGYFIDRFGIYLDSTMLRNVLRTDVKEARELFAWAMLPHLLWHAGLPLWVLWRIRLRPSGGLFGAAGRRLAWWLVAALAGTLALLSVFQDAAATMRNRKEIRFLITPANVLWSASVVATQEGRTAARPREVIGADATRGPAATAPGQRSRLVVVVVGETARAANWGLNGYARQTTPQLAAMPDVINFAQVDSCGTNTEVSVPCLFSPWGRRQYDEARIRGSQSVLHVMHRAGVQVFWRDNQSGCKGVCEGLPQEIVEAAAAPTLCDRERCLDEALLVGLDEKLPAKAGTDQLLVLHQLGNHGPAYDRRYPDAFRRFVPVCDTADLRRCSREQIVNAYDNALLYTDEVLARTIAWLHRRSATQDVAMIYVSDHGESLGEGGLFLHGLPYAIAPREQTRVPMVWWMSEGFASRRGIDLGCLRQRAAQPASHDHLFHSLLGLLDVRTALYDRTLDLAATCHR